MRSDVVDDPLRFSLGPDPIGTLVAVIPLPVDAPFVSVDLPRCDFGPDNPANVDVHRRTTAQEVLRDFADSPPDAIITGVGTGGHITAAAEVLKKQWTNLKVFAVEPAASPILNGGKPGPHPIQGLGANFIPSILDTSLLDGVIDVEADAAKEMARRAAREEGMLVGISSGATLAAIEQKLPELGDHPRILGFNYDTGERYLSVPDFLPEQ